MQHTIDLTHPEFVKIKLNNGNRQEDETYFDNQKDKNKIGNRDISPEDMQNAYKMAYHTINSPGVKIRY